MQLSSDEITKGTDLLIEGMDEIEKRLVQGGFPYEHAHDWMFNMREILFTWRYVEGELVKVVNETDLDEIPGLLEDAAITTLFSMGSEIEQHMNDLLELLKPYTNNNADDSDAGSESSQSTGHDNGS